MSSRLGQTIQRYNAAMSSNGQTTPESQQGLQNSSDSGGGGWSAPPAPITSNIAATSCTTPNTGSTTSTVASVIHSHHHAPYKGHRGHRRGHSYGGAISPPHQSVHHSQLEARPSHPNTAAAHHGALPNSASSSSSHWQKGHRRALSGCLPMVGMGAVAWSSLRDLDATAGSSNLPHHPYHHTPPLRSLSPETGDHKPRPLSPEVVLSTGKLTPLSPAPSSTDGTDLRRKRSLSDSEKRLTSSRRKKSKGSKNKKDEDRLHDISLDSMECGLGPCRLPQCFQKLANIQFFVFILAILVTLQQAVASGYVNSVITTIESRFEIQSRFVGMVASSYEMGNVITVMFVSYLGAKRHIPRWIAVGVLVMVVGCVVFTLPEFLTPAINQPSQHSYEHLNNSKISTGLMFASMRPEIRNGICHSANPQSSKFISEDGSHASENLLHAKNDSNHHYPSVTKQELALSYGCTVEIVDEQGKLTTKSSQTEESYGHPLILFMLAQLLLGCGGSPLFTLGITYVDDHVPAESSSVYIGIIYAMAAFGPVLGFLVGAYFLSVDSGMMGPDGKPIGTWWGGYLIAGALLFVTCLPFLTFPRISSNKESVSDDEEEEDDEKDVVEITSDPIQHDSFEEELEVHQGHGDETQQQLEGPKPEYGQSIKDLPKSIWRLITNPTYVVTCLGGCMELNIVSGFVVFLPKYLETQFELGKSQASVYVGGIAIPGACLGIFAGGYLVKRLQLKPSGAAKFVIATNIICLVGYVFFFFLGCPNPNLAGGTVPYPGERGLDDGGFNLNLTSSCNSECSCDNSLDPQLVCHEGVTYYSPCHAGCSVNMSQCACAGGGSVSPGRCADSPSPCNTLLPFMIVLFFMTGTVAVTQMPLLMIVLRSVTPEERSFALGMQFVIFRIFGYIPSPIIFGNVIDSSCLLWKVKRCSFVLPAVSGRCLLYDIQDFRYKYVGVLSGLKLCALALFLYDFFQLKRIEEREEKEGQLDSASGKEVSGGASSGGKSGDKGDSAKPKSGSIISLDKLFQESDTASAMTTITTATTSTSAVQPNQQHPYPMTSESACVNQIGGGNLNNLMILEPTTSLSSDDNCYRRGSSVIPTNVPGLPPGHSHID